MKNKTNHRRKTIGVLIDWTVDPFQQMFLDGVLDFVRANGMSCIIFEGGSLNSPHEYEAQRNLVFKLAGDKVVDGLVILSASIGLFKGRAGMVSFCEQYRPLPLVSVSMELDDIPSVLIDNQTGMRELVTHLIDQHASRRLAFVKGPTGNLDSDERWEACEEVLRTRGIPIDPGLVYQGDFTTGSGVEAVRYFLDKGAKNIDTIVAFDDGTAIGVLQELARRKIRVPGQIAVTGFDNIDLSGYMTPALTTVKLPVYKQGWTSAKLLRDLLEGKDVPLKTYLPTKLIVRESCQCFSHPLPVVEREGAGARHSGGDGFRSLEEQFPRIHETIRDYFVTGVAENHEHPIRSPENDPAEKSGSDHLGSMITQFDRISSRSEMEDLDYETFRSMLFELWQNRTTTALGHDLAIKNEDLLFQSMMKLGHKVVQKEWNRINEFLQERQKLELIRELLVITDIREQMNVLAHRLPDLGIESCYLSLYKGDLRTGHQNATCILGIREMRHLDTGTDGIDFPSARLVPNDFLSGGKQRLAIVEPLKEAGFVLFEIGPGSNRFAAFLGDIISGAMQGALWFKEVEDQKEGISQNLENTRKAMAGFIQTMSSMVEARDPYTAGHQRRVSDLARSIAQEMNLPPAKIEGVRMAGIIHDLGKLYIPAEILNRPGALDDIEWTMMKRHPKVAYDILKNIDFPWPIADIVYQHHERLNGSGYPNGLKAGAVSPEARVLAVADVVEAMSSRRPYREALGVDKALEEITKNRGTLYEPAAVDACLNLFRNKRYKFRTTDFFGNPYRKP